MFEFEQSISYLIQDDYAQIHTLTNPVRFLFLRFVCTGKSYVVKMACGSCWRHRHFLQGAKCCTIFFCIKWVLHDCLGRNWDSLKQQTCEQWQWLLNLCKFMIIWGYTSKYIRDCDHVFMVVYFKAKIGCQHQHFG